MKQHRLSALSFPHPVEVLSAAPLIAETLPVVTVTFVAIARVVLMRLKAPSALITATIAVEVEVAMLQCGHHKDSNTMLMGTLVVDAVAATRVEVGVALVVR